MDFLTRFKNNLKSDTELDCFHQCLLPHSGVMYRSAYRLCMNKQDAEDLVQETFFFAIKNFHQLKDRTKSKYWLFSILRNLFLKDIEKKKNRIEIEFDGICEVLSTNHGPENDFLKGELKNMVQLVLEKLEDRLRVPITLFYFEGLSYKEIAHQLDIPIGTVMSRIARGKVYMKRELSRCDSFRIEMGPLPRNPD